MSRRRSPVATIWRTIERHSFLPRSAPVPKAASRPCLNCVTFPVGVPRTMSMRCAAPKRSPDPCAADSTRLRHYGVLGNRGRAQKLALCPALLAQPAPEPREPETPQPMMLRLTGIDITVCRRCGRARLRQTFVLAPQTHAFVPVPPARPP